MGPRRLLAALIAWLSWLGVATWPYAAELKSLPPSDMPRFQVTDRVWPEATEHPHICLWKNDALAALSITIDDNTAPDHAWWIDQTKRYDFRVTWFVITSLINDQRPGYHGSWDAFRRLHGAGHDIQSHSITHVSPDRGFDPDDPKRDLRAEYSLSRQIIEHQIPGQRVQTLAYPGGKYQRNHTDTNLAAEYYLAARGGAGQINPANQINYRQTNSIGNGLYVEDPDHARLQLVNLIDRQRAYRPAQFRGWYVSHFHRVPEEDKARLEQSFAFLQQRRADIWTGLFREVATYGQQRDTAELTVTRTTGREIVFQLTDDMDDDWFNFPLTIKIRVPENWGQLRAQQRAQPLPLRTVEHDGIRYALVQAVPDRGEVVLESTP